MPTTPARPEHLVKSYDQELKRLAQHDHRDGRHRREPGGAAPPRRSCSATPPRPRASVEADPKVDALEREVEQFVIRLLALRQPVAGDLRNIVAALKITGDLERIGDYAANVAKRSIVLSQFATATQPGRPRAHGAARAGAT